MARHYTRREALAVGGGAVAAASLPGLAHAATPRRGGTLVFGTSSPPLGFDPPKWWAPLEWSGVVALFDGLVAFTPGGKGVRPALLASMPKVERGGTFYTFRLRKGVKFHHGRELTADDVKFSLERLVAPATASQGASLYTGLTIPGMEAVLHQRSKTLAGIKVVDRHTLTIELEKPDSVFLYVLALPFAGIVPRDVVEQVGDKKFNLAPVGTGPFTVKPFDPSKGFTFERNSNYWNRPLPHLDRVQWTIGVDPQLSVLRIRKGQQDLMIEGVPKGSLAQLAGNPSLRSQLFVDLINDVKYFTLSLKHPALKSLKVRQAIAMAVDKDRYVRTIDGLGVSANGGLFSPLSPYYQPGLGYRRDPARAKQLLAAAGFGKGFDVTFWGIDVSPFLEMGETVQQDLGELGVKVTYKPMPVKAYISINVKNPAGLTDNEWPLPYPHGSYVMDGGFTQAALKAGCCNFSDWRSPSFDRLAGEAHRTSDPRKIAALYRRMDREVVRDEALWVPMIYPKRADFVSARLRGFRIEPAPSADTRFFAHYWLAS